MKDLNIFNNQRNRNMARIRGSCLGSILLCLACLNILFLLGLGIYMIDTSSNDNIPQVDTLQFQYRLKDQKIEKIGETEYTSVARSKFIRFDKVGYLVVRTKDGKVHTFKWNPKKAGDTYPMIEPVFKEYYEKEK